MSAIEDEEKTGKSVNIKLSCGYTCKIDEETLDDMELLEALIAAGNGDLLQFPFFLERLLGSAEEKKRLYDCLRNEKGRVPSAAVGAAVGEMIAQVNDLKK